MLILSSSAIRKGARKEVARATGRLSASWIGPQRAEGEPTMSMRSAVTREEAGGRKAGFFR
jgi:hypothetical protein